MKLGQLQTAVEGLPRFIATPTLSKYRLFAWLPTGTLADHQLIVFARDDDYFFGVLHSRPHEVWALALGTQLETRPRYTPTSTFETFPFPVGPADDVVGEIADAAKQLVKLRVGWQNPPGLPGSELANADEPLQLVTNLAYAGARAP